MCARRASSQPTRFCLRCEGFAQVSAREKGTWQAIDSRSKGLLRSREGEREDPRTAATSGHPDAAPVAGARAGTAGADERGDRRPPRHHPRECEVPRLGDPLRLGVNSRCKAAAWRPESAITPRKRSALALAPLAVFGKLKWSPGAGADTARGAAPELTPLGGPRRSDGPAERDPHTEGPAESAGPSGPKWLTFVPERRYTIDRLRAPNLLS
jgi:hypothetical protein